MAENSVVSKVARMVEKLVAKTVESSAASMVPGSADMWVNCWADYLDLL